ncbi:hypothetical protein ENBRE01_0008 [Enteropsectra breve]|nr:hypothetical protein ENBRE01_0008 [Enteropsectra breve]
MLFCSHMYKRDSRRIALPLNKNIIDYIHNEYPAMQDMLTSTIENAITGSEQHHSDLVNSTLSLMLNDELEMFVEKLFELNGHAKYASFDKSSFDEKAAGETNCPAKKSRNENCEIILNRINEMKHSFAAIREHAMRFGTVVHIRRLNRGKYLVEYSDPREAQSLIESSMPILEDQEIKKFYNVVGAGSEDLRIDVHALLQKQKDIIDRISRSEDLELLGPLKSITWKIRSYILAKEDANDNTTSAKRHKNVVGTDGANDEEGNSIYSKLFDEN